MLSLLPVLGPAFQEGTWCSYNRGKASAGPLVLGVRGPALPTVSQATVWGQKLWWEEITAFSSGLSRPSGLSWWVSWGPGTAWGLCPTELQSPHHGRPLVRPRPWSSKPLPIPISRPNGGGGLHEWWSKGPGPHLGCLRNLRASWVLGAWLLQW